jgi:hypothetical protein
MKKEEAAKRFLESGLIAFIGEYRGSKAETIKWVDKKTGRAMTAPTVRHTVELPAGDAVTVSERVADDLNVGAYVPPYKKGDRVVVQLTAFQNDKGLYRASGVLQALTS